MNESILAGIGSLIAPLFAPLGFGSNLDNYVWIFAVAAATGLIAKENVIATFGTLLGYFIIFIPILFVTQKNYLNEEKYGSITSSH